jgi:hypothetical protein
VLVAGNTSKYPILMLHAASARRVRAPARPHMPGVVACGHMAVPSTVGTEVALRGRSRSALGSVEHCERVRSDHEDAAN